MTCAPINSTPCSSTGFVNGLCVYYSGPFIPCGHISNGMNFNNVILALVNCINASITTTTTTTTTSTSTTTTTTLPTTSTTSTSTTTLPTTTTTSTTSTTTTTTTSTSTSTSTTTTTTHTITSSSTTSTSSSTTTSTTTSSSLATVYFDAQLSATPPNAAAVIAGDSEIVNPSIDVPVDWTPFNGSPMYCWAAIPSADPKTKWFGDSLNHGTIGGATDLFGAPTVVVIGGVNYNVYITQFQTQFTEVIQLQA